MDIEFWLQRWQQNQIGFHLDEVNPWLARFWAGLNVSPGHNVFVPLCGKSHDLVWLANSGFNVCGVECSRIAVDAFFNEQGLVPEIVDQSRFCIYSAGRIRLLQGDFFDLAPPLPGPIDAVYDRAALIALPQALRQSYVNKMYDLILPDTRILLVTLEYDQSAMAGPPFSVSQDEVCQLYSTRFDITILHREDMLPHQPRFAQRGLDVLVETVYFLRPKSVQT